MLNLDGAAKSIIEKLSKDPKEEKLQKIALMLTAVLEQVETSRKKKTKGNLPQVHQRDKGDTNYFLSISAVYLRLM